MGARENAEVAGQLTLLCCRDFPCISSRVPVAALKPKVTGGACLVAISRAEMTADANGRSPTQKPPPFDGHGVWIWRLGLRRNSWCLAHVQYADVRLKTRDRMSAWRSSACAAAAAVERLPRAGATFNRSSRSQSFRRRRPRTLECIGAAVGLLRSSFTILPMAPTNESQRPHASRSLLGSACCCCCCLPAFCIWCNFRDRFSFTLPPPALMRLLPAQCINIPYST